MSIADLKLRMRDIPGIETLTQSIQNGQQVFTLNDRTHTFGTGDSEATVEQGIRAAIAAPALVQMAAGRPVTPDVAANAAAALHPALQATMPTPPPATVQSTAHTVTNAGGFASEVRDMIEGHKADMNALLQAHKDHMRAGFDKQIRAARAFGKMAEDVHSAGDEMLAMMGQYTNNLE